MWRFFGLKWGLKSLLVWVLLMLDFWFCFWICFWLLLLFIRLDFDLMIIDFDGFWFFFGFSFFCELWGVICVCIFWNLWNSLLVLLRCRVCKRFFYLFWFRGFWDFFFFWNELLKDWWVFFFILNGLGVWENVVNGLFLIFFWVCLYNLLSVRLEVSL